MIHAPRFAPAIGLAMSVAAVAACSGMVGPHVMGADSAGTGGTLAPGTGGNGGAANTGQGGTTNAGRGGDSPDMAADAGGGAGGSGPDTAGDAGAGVGGAGAGTGMVPDPFAVPATCSSKVTWKGGSRQGSGSMDPGMPCIDCHSTSDRAPIFGVAGTLYPTAHEPDLCNGANGSVGAKVVVTDANGLAVTLYPNAAGSFYYQDTIATPYTAKVIYMGRERAMATAQTSGDCNSCHTQYGAMSAPGRILLP